jgi:hypothetical protein
MDFDPHEYVQRGGPDDDFPDGVARIAYCRYCGAALLCVPAQDDDCGRHLN